MHHNNANMSSSPTADTHSHGERIIPEHIGASRRGYNSSVQVELGIDRRTYRGNLVVSAPFRMASRVLLVLAVLCWQVHAFSNTFPVVAWSSHRYAHGARDPQPVTIIIMIYPVPAPSNIYRTRSPLQLTQRPCWRPYSMEMVYVSMMR